MQELAVIIPMFNEEINAERCVREVCSVLSARLPGAKLIVVDDGSSDQTPEILKKLQTEGLPFTYFQQLKNGGYGAALLSGMRHAQKLGFVFGLAMDCDLTNPPSALPLFAEKLATGKYDLVKACRFMPGGGLEGVPAFRQFFSHYGNLVARALFRMGLKDCTNGFHAVRLELLNGLEFHERGFAFLLEELYHLKKRGARIAEVPSVLTSRRADVTGVSKFAYKPKVLWAYLKYALKASVIFGPASRSAV